jgi:predicted ester cyclase
MLLRTTRMRTVHIDPAARTARAGAGAVWPDVTVPAAQHGLAALAGSSPTVGVTGYILGGGLGWLARRYGLAANSVTAAELVTPDGDLVRADAGHEPDLFWAVRGGGGVGAVTALENHEALFSAVGREANRQFWHTFFAAIPDLSASMEDLVIAGDRVVGRFVYRGTHTGDLMGIPPSGNTVEMRSIDIWRVEDGMFAEHWDEINAMQLFQQMGATLLPQLAALAAIAGTGVVYGSDVFCALVQRPALARVDDATLTAVMGNVHSFADRRMQVAPAGQERVERGIPHRTRLPQHRRIARQFPPRRAALLIHSAFTDLVTSTSQVAAAPTQITRIRPTGILMQLQPKPAQNGYLRAAVAAPTEPRCVASTR